MTGSIPVLGKIAIGSLDIGVIVLCFVVILGVGIWAGLKRRGARPGARATFWRMGR
jgi:hypothetical protein